MSRFAARFEDAVAATALAVMTVIPLLEIVLRRAFGVGIPAAGPIVQHLVLWVGFLGAAIAAREGRLLSLATGSLVPAGWPRRVAAIVAAALGSAVAVILALAAVEFVQSERGVGSSFGAGIPTWMAELVLPIGFTLIALRLAWRASDRWAGRAVAASGLVAGWVIGSHPSLLEGRSPLPGLVLIVLGGALGAPIFAILGGAAAVLFMADGVTPAAILIETYSLSVSPTLAAIPLFTLTGFLLAEGRASERLLRVFRSLVGWIPGGTAVVCAVLCSFFTAFTGGSGITILALGGVLFPALLRDGYRDRFSLGLLTASGSLGLLLPPSLPLMLYGVVAQMPIENLFIGGLLPGLLLTAMMSAWGMREGIVSGAGRQNFAWAEAGAALWEAKWELAMPVVVVLALFSGLATSVEAAALTAAYALFTQAVIHRDLSIRRDLLRVFAECVGLIGGVLVILGVAVGLTSWLVGAQVPMHLVEFTRAHIASRTVFLLALNVFLILVGCLMEIFPAIVVVVPLIVPLGAAFDVHPVHLGIIFIANLELGYLTPLVGLNILLASYRFKRPVLEVARAALPMAGILAVGVLVITYVPWLTLGLLRMLGRL
ncbi:MAG TPA: TRAP transporter large permease subunit [Vicinamibacterales bacterium]|nr:TRAP transporter large permease subunit [Vicinamibacterales bacterium]